MNTYWDTYQINSNELWYGILYPIIFIIVITIHVIKDYSPLNLENYIPENGTYLEKLSLKIVIYIFTATIGIIAEIIWNQTWKTDNIIDIILKDVWVQVYLLSLVGCAIYYMIIVLIDSYTSVSNTRANNYEPFTAPDIQGTLTQVQQVTQSLQDSLDILDQATDDTCSVIKGIEQKFLDNITSPSGDGDPPSKEEAKEIKAQKLPGAIKQWKQKQQDWADTHGQIPVVECFETESLSDLVSANQQLSDLLASAPVQRVVAQVKRLQTSELFAQKYMDDLVNELSKQTEGFANPEDTIATSNKLIQQAKDVQAQIQRILASTTELKKNYAALNAKANDPNTVNNLAQSTSS